MSEKTTFAQKFGAFSHKLFGTTPNDGDIQPKEGWSYSIAGIGQNFICTVIGSYLTVFMTDALGFNIDMKVGALSGVTAVAILMLVARLFDAFNDPIMGSIVDRTRTKYGKCRPYLLWMAIPIGIMTILCFLPWYPTSLEGFIAVSLIYVVWSVVYTVADVPYWGLSTTMTNNTTKRGNLLTIARLFCTAGAGIVTIFVPIITDAVTAKYRYTTADGKSLVNPLFAAENAQTLQYTYLIIAIVLVVISMPLFYIGFKNTKERCGTIEDNQKLPSFGHNLKLLFKNKELMLIVLSGILGGARMVYTYTGGLYFCKYALGNESAYGLLTMLVVPGGLIASVLCPWLTDARRARRTYRFGALSVAHEEVYEEMVLHRFAYTGRRGYARDVLHVGLRQGSVHRDQRNSGTRSVRYLYVAHRYPAGYFQHNDLRDDRRHRRISRVEDGRACGRYLLRNADTYQ